MITDMLVVIHQGNLGQLAYMLRRELENREFSLEITYPSQVPVLPKTMCRLIPGPDGRSIFVDDLPDGSMRMVLCTSAGPVEVRSLLRSARNVFDPRAEVCMFFVMEGRLCIATAHGEDSDSIERIKIEAFSA